MKVRNMRGLVAVVLALVMTLTMMPAVFAEDELQNHINGAETVTVKLTADTTECIVIPAGKTVTLDLNGFTLSGGTENDDTIANRGTLTIVDSSAKKNGKIVSDASEKAAIVNYPDGKVTIQGGEITGTGWFVIKNMGSMEIYAGAKVTFDDSTKAMIDNGWVNGSDPSQDRNQVSQPDKAKLTIYGGEFSGGKYNVKNDDYGELTIHGGKFSVTGESCWTILNSHIATINGGDFASKKSVLLNGALNDTSNQGKVNVTGGTFVTTNPKGGIFDQASFAEQKMGWVTVTGGTFTGNIVPTYLGYITFEVKVSGGVFSEDVSSKSLVKVTETAASATITSGGKTVYVLGEESIAEKVAELREGDEVELLQNVTELSNVPGGVTVKNSTGESVTVGDETVEDGEEITIPLPPPVEQPSGPVYYPDYDEPSAPAQPSAAQQYAVSCRTLNVRAGAGVGYEKIGTLSRGTVIEGVAENGWVKFTAADGRVGYVSADYLRALDDDSQMLTVTCRKLNVRAGAGVNYAKVGTLSRGQTVEVLGAADGWYHIACGAGSAWVSAKYVG